MAEPIEMHAIWDAELGSSGEHVLHGDKDAPMGRGIFGMSGRLQSVVKHLILGLGNTVSCAKNGFTDLDLNNLYII